jgi:DGQHR domain-containing protein
MAISTAELNGDTSPSAAPALRAAAVRIKQKQSGVNLYVTALPLKELLGRYQPDTYASDNPRGYQRPLTKSRLRQISEYLRDEEGMLPTSILLCIRKPHEAHFEPVGDHSSGGDAGTLTVDAAVPMWVVDGQHRLAGLERALTKDKAKWLADYPLPVVIVDGIDAYEEMRYFHVINTRHKGVPTDVVDRHLLSMRETEGVALIEREGEKNYRRARATMLTDKLNSEADSPWRGLIRMPGDKPNPKQTMRQHSMVTSLDPVVADGVVARASDEEAWKLLLNYWLAARDLWGSAFETPTDYVIQRPLGAGALHQVFPDVIELCRTDDDYSSEKMNDILSYVGRSAGFWHTVRGHHLVRESGARYVRALAEYLRERLPRPVLRRL